MNNINRDRGTKKWTAMMLPEHVELLRDWMDEDHWVEKPEFDEWEFELIQEELERGVKSKNIVRIETWNEGLVNAFQGMIIKQDFTSRSIYLQDPFNVECIKVDDIIRVEQIT